MKRRTSLLTILVFCALLGSTVGLNPALYLSQYLPNNASLARSLSQTLPIEGLESLAASYSGYITVNASTQSNIFFWLFDAQKPTTSNPPLIAWMNGGPGSSSMFGLFQENGPIEVSTDFAARPRKETWNEEFAMVFIDQPVGTGWSFTESTEGFVTNEEEVADDLYSFFQQFFQIFSEYRKSRLIISAESYGGKYGPAISYRILQENGVGTHPQINLWGLTIGDGMMDPAKQTQGMSNAWYQLCLIDREQMAVGMAYEAKIRSYIEQEEWLSAFAVWDEFLNGDFYPYPTFYQNTTGLHSYYNYDTPVYAPSAWREWMVLPKIRDAIHVGDRRYWDYNATVESYLKADWMQSVAGWMPYIMENIHVMLYNGQFDIILAAPQDEAFINTLAWEGALQFIKARRQIWKVSPTDYEPSGYVKQALNFTYVQVRQCGHICPQDQPVRCKDMIERFVNGRAFA